MMNFDDIYKQLGDWGKYQKLYYFLVIIPGIFTGMQMMSPVFTLAIPKHRCSIKGLHNDTFAVQSAVHQQRINSSIPYDTSAETGEITLSSCEIYVTSNGTQYTQTFQPINVTKQDCSSWVYDKSVFRSTFMTQENLVCEKEVLRSHANMIMFAGVLVGSLGGGIFADIFGRKSALMASIVIHIIAGFGTAFAPNYGVFVAFRFLVGMGNMGIAMSKFVLGMEIVGPSKRTFAGVVVEFVWCLALYLLLLAAYFVRDWNILYIVIVAPEVLLLSYFFIIPESARWLLSKGRKEDANKIIRHAANVNGVKLPADILDKTSSDDEKRESVLKMFTSPSLLIRTLIVYFNWCVVSMVYYGLSLNVGNLAGDIYVNFAISTTMEVVAYALCLALLDKLGRKVIHASTMILGGVACVCTIFSVLYSGKSLAWTSIVLSNVGKFGISAAFAVIYVWSAELFPTPMRNSGMGSSSMCARIGGMVSPYIADSGKFIEGPFQTALPLLIFGGLSIAAGLLSLFLPETRGTILPDTVEEAKKFTSGKAKRTKEYIVNSAFETDEKKHPPFTIESSECYSKL